MHNVVNMREDFYQRTGLEDLCNYVVKYVDAPTLLEVGCYQGESTAIFGQYMQHITCVDIWENIPELLDDSTMRYSMELVEENFDERTKSLNITKVKQNFQDFDINKQYDVIYIDANHEYDHVLNDIIKVLNLPHELLPKFLAGHDYTGGWPGVIKAVDNIFGQPDKVFNDNSWIKQLR